MEGALWEIFIHSSIGYSVGFLAVVLFMAFQSWQNSRIQSNSSMKLSPSYLKKQNGTKKL